MLPKNVAEALQFLTRRHLDKASAVSRWLDAMITRYCDVYPLRQVATVELHYQCVNDFTLKVWTTEDESPLALSFGSMDEAASFGGAILRHSYVDDLEVILADFMMKTLMKLVTTLISGKKDPFSASR